MGALKRRCAPDQADDVFCRQLALLQFGSRWPNGDNRSITGASHHSDSPSIVSATIPTNAGRHENLFRVSQCDFGCWCALLDRSALNPEMGLTAS